MFGFSRTRFVIVALGVVVFVLVLIGGYYVLGRQHERATSAARQLAAEWSDNKLVSTRFSNAGAGQATPAVDHAVGSLAGTPVRVTATTAKVHGKSATSLLQVDWQLGAAHWKYNTTLHLSKVNNVWMPDWQPSLVHPSLTKSNSLLLKRVQPKRAEIQGLDGQVLVTDSPVVRVGVSPQRVSDVDATTRQLASVLDVDQGALAQQVRAAKPDAFVDVITLRQSDYDAVKAALYPIPGAVFEQSSLPLAPTRQFASALLGRVGPVTADIVKASNGRYKAGDSAGLSGLQFQYDKQLAGTTGLDVSVVPDDVNQSAQTLFSVAPVAGTPLQTTVDTKTQEAADAAVSGQTKPTSLVSIRPSTGQVLAVANGPDVAEVNRAFTGQYPPGSSFKVVTAYALLGHGVNNDDSVACPPTITVDGRVFKNAENETFASAPFHTAFAKSCNTAFIGLAPRVPGPALSDTAATFGIGAKWDMGVSAFSGSVPRPSTNVDLAATAFGQGKTLVSPLAMANVAAAIASGNARQPTLLTGSQGSLAAARQLDPNIVSAVQSDIREVVTSGTGTAAGNVPGGDVFAKTGTAEFGDQDPPQTHAWFIGYQGDVAFAVLVEGGGFGGDVAAPIAAKFLTGLAG